MVVVVELWQWAALLAFGLLVVAFMAWAIRAFVRSEMAYRKTMEEMNRLLDAELKLLSRLRREKESGMLHRNGQNPSQESRHK